MKKARFGELDVRVTGGPDNEGGGTGPVVVLCHGYGAPGDDLVPLARVLDVPKEVRFVFPVAPKSLGGAYYGEARAWWDIDMAAVQEAMMRGKPRDFTAEVPPGLGPARDLLVHLLDEVQERMGVTGERLVLGGFSQGAMLSMDVALRTNRKLAGLALLSGTFLAADQWTPLMAARAGLPVFQDHGTEDQMLPYAYAERLRDELVKAGLKVEWHSFRGGHEIPQPVLIALGAFLRRVTNG